MQGKTFVVTGAASGIGLGVARRLVGAGAAVAMLDVDAPRLSAAASELGGEGRTLAVECDVSDADSVDAAVGRARSELGEVWGAVTSAGIFDPADFVELEGLDLAVFDRVLAVNLRGTVLVLKAVLPHLPEGGSIVTVASTAGLRGHGFGPSYTASKGAVVALTRLLATQYGPRGIRVNCVCPGATAGEGMGAAFLDEEMAARATADVPLRRVGTGDEVGAAIAMLLGDDAGYVTGQVIAVDGGATVR